MSDFKIAIPELSGFVARYREGARIVTEELARAGKRAGLAVERGAKGYAPVDTGNLRRSITTATSVAPLAVTTTVGTAVTYARAVEFGRGAGRAQPPSGAIAAWLARKGSDPSKAFVVARSIGRRGIAARPFLTRAFKELQGQIRREFDQVPRRVVARLSGGR